LEKGVPTEKPTPGRKNLPIGTAAIIEDKIAQEKADEWFMNATRFKPLPSYSSIEEFDLKLRQLEDRSSIVAERARISNAMTLRLTKEVNIFNSIFTIFVTKMFPYSTFCSADRFTGGTKVPDRHRRRFVRDRAANQRNLTENCGHSFRSVFSAKYDNAKNLSVVCDNIGTNFRS
jgi:hypothetical protein